MRIEEITFDAVQKWKEQYPAGVFEVNVDDKTAYFRNLITSEIKSGRISKVFNKDPLKTAINTLKLTWLGGDKELLTEPDYAIAAFNQLQPIFEARIKHILPNMKF